MKDEEYSPTNREKVREPHSDKSHWCGGCDAALVHEGQKCPYCGKRDKGKERAPKKDAL